MTPPRLARRSRGADRWLAPEAEFWGNYVLQGLLVQPSELEFLPPAARTQASDAALLVLSVLSVVQRRDALWRRPIGYRHADDHSMGWLLAGTFCERARFLIGGIP